MKRTYGGLICAITLGLVAYGAQAASDAEKMHKADYDAAVARADAEYKSASEACNAKQGNDKDVCIQEAKAARAKADADAKAALKSRDAF